MNTARGLLFLQQHKHQYSRFQRLVLPAIGTATAGAAYLSEDLPSGRAGCHRSSSSIFSRRFFIKSDKFYIKPHALRMAPPTTRPGRGRSSSKDGGKSPLLKTEDWSVKVLTQELPQNKHMQLHDEMTTARNRMNPNRIKIRFSSPNGKTGGFIVRSYDPRLDGDDRAGAPSSADQQNNSPSTSPVDPATALRNRKLLAALLEQKGEEKSILKSLLQLHLLSTQQKNMNENQQKKRTSPTSAEESEDALTREPNKTEHERERQLLERKNLEEKKRRNNRKEKTFVSRKDFFLLKPRGETSETNSSVKCEERKGDEQSAVFTEQSDENSSQLSSLQDDLNRNCGAFQSRGKRDSSPGSSSTTAEKGSDDGNTDAVSGTTDRLAATKTSGTTASSNRSLSAEESDTVQMFKKCAPSVCQITTRVGGYYSMNFDPIEIEKGVGSGFVWQDGVHVVTNCHVVKGASRCFVTFPPDMGDFVQKTAGATNQSRDEASSDAGASTSATKSKNSFDEPLEAEVVGEDEDCDLAILRLVKPKKKLDGLKVGTSHDLQVGNKVFAIGNPFGFDQTLTSGIVSGLGREVRGATGKKLRNLVQTDAAINPGNSGGPLLNRHGELIGINTMIASPSGAFSGVGFAIPVDTIQRVIKQFLQYGRILRPWLGIYCAPDHWVEKYSEVNGVFVLQVEPDSPAEKQQLRPFVRDGRKIFIGDVICKVDGKKIYKSEELIDAVESKEPGESLTLTVYYKGAFRVVNLKLGVKPSVGPSNSATGGSVQSHGGAGNPVRRSKL
ncbi:unnamed protein product [Amoebophrya sp. A120]|nr:unnamed protein product [Amoebophrya sp. A120]|eukprot:GSA120T00004141001.1